MTLMLKKEGGLEASVMTLMLRKRRRSRGLSYDINIKERGGGLEASVMTLLLKKEEEEASRPQL